MTIEPDPVPKDCIVVPVGYGISCLLIGVIIGLGTSMIIQICSQILNFLIKKLLGAP